MRSIRVISKEGNNKNSKVDMNNDYNYSFNYDNSFNFNTNVKKKFNINCKKSLYVLSFTLSFMAFSLCGHVNESYAKVVRAPEKIIFKQHITELYELDQGSADYERLLEKSIKDYKNRLTLYVDINYAMGREDMRNANYFYNDSNGRINYNALADLGGNLKVPQAMIDLMSSSSKGIGSKVGDANYQRAMQYFDIISDYASTYGVDPYLVVAKMCVESGGDHEGAIKKYYAGKTNAFGIMQIQKPGKTIKEAKALNVTTGQYDVFKPVTESTIRKVEDNIKVGVMMFSACVENSKGNALCAIQEYNYGCGAMKKVLELYGKTFNPPKSADDVKSNLEDYGWLPYRDNIHYHPNDYGLNCKYSTYGNNHYIEDVLCYYNAASNKEDTTGKSGITQYFQGVVPDNLKDKIEYYGSTNNLSKYGAGPTCLAMVVSTIKNSKTTPVDIITSSKKHYDKDKGADVELFTDVDSYSLICTERDNTQKDSLISELKAGKIAIVSVGNKAAGATKGTFLTGAGSVAKYHFILISGYDDEGRVYVNDPDSGNYDEILKNSPYLLDDILGETVGSIYVYNKR